MENEEELKDEIFKETTEEVKESIDEEEVNETKEEVKESIEEVKESKEEPSQTSPQMDRNERRKSKFTSSKEKRSRILYVPKAKKVEELPSEELSLSLSSESLQENIPQLKETIIPPALPNGVVLISEAQTGIEQSDIGEFIEIKSKKKKIKEKELREKQEK